MIAHFDRIGRQVRVEPLTLKDGTPDDIAQAIYSYARKFTISRDIEVIVDLEAKSGTIYAGLQVAGHFTLSKAQP